MIIFLRQGGIPNRSYKNGGSIFKTAYFVLDKMLSGKRYEQWC